MTPHLLAEAYHGWLGRTGCGCGEQAVSMLHGAIAPRSYYIECSRLGSSRTRVAEAQYIAYVLERDQRARRVLG